MPTKLSPSSSLLPLKRAKRREKKRNKQTRNEKITNSAVVSVSHHNGTTTTTSIVHPARCLINQRRQVNKRKSAKVTYMMNCALHAQGLAPSSARFGLVWFSLVLVCLPSRCWLFNCNCNNSRDRINKSRAIRSIDWLLYLFTSRRRKNPSQDSRRPR